MNTKEQPLGTGQSHVGKSKIICFDVDGTLRDYHDKPRDKVIAVLRLYVDSGWRVFVWSGGGRDYARSVGNMLSLPASVEYTSKTIGIVLDGVRVKPDIAVDDQHVNLGERNVYVGLKGDAY